MGSKPSRKTGRKTDSQEDGQEDDQEDDDVVKYTILNDWFKPKHYAKAHDSNLNI